MVIGVLALLGLGWFTYTKKPFQFRSGQSLGALTDLTQRARSGLIDRVIGRDEEIDRVIQVLSRRKKNNPLLLGEPGVGKTSIVEGLAQRIVDQSVPTQLKTAKLCILDLNTLMAGTQYRGDLERRLEGILTQAIGSGNTILFIDEIHLLQQMGKTEGALSISDVIKPVLANGELQIIGATTWREYQAFIRPDEAFDRRLQPVIVSEPSPEEAIEMLSGLKPLYEDFHKVIITPEAIEASDRLSNDLIDHRYLPDKAIDLIDEACARVAIEGERSTMMSAGVLHAASKAAKDTVTEKDIRLILKQWTLYDKTSATQSPSFKK